MKLMTACLLSTFILFAAPHAVSVQAACHKKTLMVDKVLRSGLVCAPAAMQAQAGLPLVFAFHGRGSSAREMAAATRLHQAWPQALVVYLDGLAGNPAPYDEQGLRRGWQIHPGQLQDRDIRFVDMARQALGQHYAIDARRIYAVGHSNGARLAAILWAHRGEEFAAFAFSAAQADTLTHDAPPRSVFLGMGWHDRVVPFDWQRQSVAYARARLHIVADMTMQPDQLLVARNPDGLELAVYGHSGAHVWPPEQTSMIIDFFKRQSLPAAGSAPAVGR